MVFSFDGTLSTLRRGWENVMASMTANPISDGSPTPETENLVFDYIGRFNKLDKHN